MNRKSPRPVDHHNSRKLISGDDGSHGRSSQVVYMVCHFLEPRAQNLYYTLIATFNSLALKVYLDQTDNYYSYFSYIIYLSTSAHPY